MPFWVPSNAGATLRHNCGWWASVRAEGEQYVIELCGVKRRGYARSLPRAMYYAERMLHAPKYRMTRRSWPDMAAAECWEIREWWVRVFRGELPLFPDIHTTDRHRILRMPRT
ncbi:hypothetical protein [Lysobacter humi (ex Lee et al. 2017)]